MKTKIFISALFLSLIFYLPASAQQTAADKSASTAGSTQMADSDDELRRAIESSSGSETQIVVNLEDYLKKYPKSARKDEIENEIYKLSVKLRDRSRAIAYAEKLIAKDEDNIDALTNLVAILRERRAEGDLNKALSYSDQLVKKVEGILASSSKPKRLSSAQWLDRKERGMASIYLLRGRVNADLNNYDKAQADLLKSYKASRLAGAALSLAEIAEKRKNNDEAIDYYIQAFVIAIDTEEEIDVKATRRKLNQLYVAKNGSEAGLGDRVLKFYDVFVKEREDRAAKLEQPNINTGLTDPLMFKLSKLDGTTLEMSGLRGKVIVINFWATWCGPCLTELPLFEKTMAKYKDDKDVVFLALTTDEDRDLVPPFLKQHKFNLPIAYAEYLNDLFAVNSIPTTIILDRSGQISFRQAGFNPREDFVVMLSEKIGTAKKK